MSRKAGWLMSGAVALIVAGAAYWLYAAHLSPAARLRNLPAGEQNRIVYDAAIALLRSNYYDPALFEHERWATFEAHWRKQAEEYPGRGIWFYMNVLRNFATGFPASHVGFEHPPGPAAPPPRFESRKPAEATPKGGPQPRPRVDFASLSTGFDTATIRRGLYLQNVVTEVWRGSPAERAGVTPGWSVGMWAYNGNDRSLHFKGTFYRLEHPQLRELERTGLPIVTESQAEMDAYLAARATDLEFDLSAAPPRADFETRRLPDGATYLRFDSFNDWGLVGRVIDVIDAAGPRGLVLDLRRNGGGLMLHMQRINGRLLGDDVELGQLRGRDSSSAVLSLKMGGGHYEGPLVVLIGPASSSAAEITAAAVQHQRRGILLGRTTNGSVVSARKFALPDGGTMLIPTQDFLRPDGRRIEATGVEPDIWIVPTLQDVRAGRDPVLDRAVVELRTSAARLSAHGGSRQTR